MSFDEYLARFVASKICVVIGILNQKKLIFFLKKKITRKSQVFFKCATTRPAATVVFLPNEHVVRFFCVCKDFFKKKKKTMKNDRYKFLFVIEIVDFFSKILFFVDIFRKLH